MVAWNRSRYVWTEKSVIEARLKLCENLKSNGIDGEEILLKGIDEIMNKYFTSFNLKDVSHKIEKELKANRNYNIVWRE